MLTIACPKCGRELKAQDQYAGRPVRCPQCGTICRLPGGTRAEAEAAPLLVCAICTRNIVEGQDWVKDTQGRCYHRSCYDDAWRCAGQRADQPIQLTAANVLTNSATAAVHEQGSAPLSPIAPTRERGSSLGWLIGLGVTVPAALLLTMVILAVVPRESNQSATTASGLALSDSERRPDAVSREHAAASPGVSSVSRSKREWKTKPTPNAPVPTGLILFQPKFYWAGSDPTLQGTGFLVKTRSGETVGVTSAHFIDPRGPVLLRAEWLEIGSETPKASFTKCWGRPGQLGIHMEAADRTSDYLLLVYETGMSNIAVLEFDVRDKPDVDERVWVPDKTADATFGYRLVEGVVVDANTLSITIVLDSPIILQSQSGSPVLSQKTGQVIGTLSSYKATPNAPLQLILCPARAIRRVLATGARHLALSQVIGRR